MWVNLSSICHQSVTQLHLTKILNGYSCSQKTKVHKHHLKIRFLCDATLTNQKNI